MKIPIIQLHLHYKKRGTNRVYRRRINIPREKDNRSDMQRILGRQLIAIEDAAEYYYVVAVVRLDDGSDGYRTVIGKHYLGDDE